MDRTLNNFVLSDCDHRHLLSYAYASNVHWSTKIEGNKIPFSEVQKISRRIMNSHNPLKCESPGQYQEIVNHIHSYFIQDQFALPWNIQTICKLHRFLMTGTGELSEPGEIRADEMSVYAEDGTETFHACPAVHVETELTSLLDWIDNTPLDTIVTAIIFFHEFESIHPFTEGNGRTGRSLLHILMQEYGLINFNLCILDVKLLENSSIYYSLMEYTDDSGDYTPIVDFFIDCIYRAYKEAIELFSAKDLLKDLDTNTWSIVDGARNSRDWFTVKDAMEWDHEQGEQSVRNRLNKLVDIGILEKEGVTRSTKFRFMDPFKDIRENLKKLEIFKDNE